MRESSTAAMSALVFGFAALIALGTVALTKARGIPQGDGAPVSGVSGLVVGEEGSPVSGANVRVQGTENRTQTDPSGGFELTGIPPGKPVHISAWKHGYYCGLTRDITPPAGDVTIKLIRYQSIDNPAYEWVPPVLPGDKGSCAQCHHPALIEMSLADAHVKSGTNPRFLTMYYGRDMEGNQSPNTRYAPASPLWPGTSAPLPPDPGEPYFGPGFLIDFEKTSGNCSACHLPGASIPDDVDPAEAKGADRFGVHCDFCHKVAGIYLDPVTRLPSPRRPGVHSMEIRRPFTEDLERPQLFFGTFEDDNVPEEDTNLPLLTESRY